MTGRNARIEQVIKILDTYPVDRYPEPFRKQMRADVETLKKELAAGIDLLLNRENSEMVGSIQEMMATMRIEIDRLLEIIR